MDIVVAGGHGKVGLGLLTLLSEMAVLSTPASKGKTFDLVSGDTAIDQALRDL